MRVDVCLLRTIAEGGAPGAVFGLAAGDGDCRAKALQLAGKAFADAAEADDEDAAAGKAGWHGTEPNYAFAHQNQALALYSGALWMDEKRCYWLDPSDASVQSFLASIALELQDLGFDEVLFDQFYFPSSDAINWSSDLGLTRQTAVQNAAEGIRAALEGSSIRVDFVSDDPAVAAQADRIAVANEDAAAVESTAAAFADVLTDPSSQLLFLTSSRDTRYENYSVLRPLLDEQ